MTGFALTVEGYEALLANETDVDRWIAEAVERLKQYEQQNNRTNTNE